MDGKTKRYKNGDPEVYRWFTEMSWKNMTDREKAMWALYSEKEPAPIPKDVIEFTKKGEQEIADLKAEVKKLKTTQKIDPTGPGKMTEDQEKKLIQEELRKMNVKFNWNTGLPKLKEKLKEAENANDPE